MDRPREAHRHPPTSAPRLAWTADDQRGAREAVIGRTLARTPAPQPPGDPSRRLAAALDAIEEAIVIWDAAGETVFRNEAARRLLTAAPRDALVTEAVVETLGHAIAGETVERRLDLIAPHRRTLSMRAKPLPEGGALAVVEDVSERLRLEAVRRDFVANVSHELKTPLGAMSLLAETIDGEDDPEVVARLARRLGAEAERLSRIVDDLLDLSRIESREGVPPTPVPVAEIVAEAVGPLGEVAQGLGVTLEVADDRRDLVSAVANLVDNAIKYSDEGDVVTVRVAVTAGTVQIAVEDQGVGIPGRDLERIFERFYRVDRARSRATGGTGLGLSIVRNVAANHGGSVRVQSLEGHGSTFVLELPLAGEASDA